ncbi:MAG: class I SAM-dependent methyltransferase [Myxococcota bacterium]
MNPSMYEAFERLEETHWWFEGRRRILREVLRRQLLPRSGRSILDVGCGTGGMFPLLSEFGAVEGAEASPDARERAQRRFPKVKVSPCRLPDGLPEGKWDVITAFDVIEHLDDPIDSLRAMRSRLVFDGQVVVTVPAFNFLWSRHDEANHHRRRYGRLELVSHLAAAGLRVTWVSYFNSLLFPAVAGARLWQRLVPPKDSGESDLTPTKEPFNRLLTELFSSERLALAVTRLPVGVSLVAVAQRG